MKKKIISLLLSILTMLNFSAVFSQSISAESLTKKMYESSGYKIEYAIKDQWGTTQIIEVKFTNTSTENIEACALKYAVKGKIENLWGAISSKLDENTTVFESSPYNFILKPNQSITYGYKNIDGDGTFPESIKLCSKRYDSSGYTVNLEKMQDYNTESTYQIVIKNTKIVPIKYWELSFDANFDILEVWNAKIIKSENGKYKIKSVENTNIIEPNSSITIGVRLKNSSDNVISNCILSEMFSNFTELSIFSIGECDDGKNIKLVWSSTVEAGKFDVLVSIDGVNYSKAASLENKSEYTYSTDNSIEKYYFKISETIFNAQNAESNVITMVRNDAGYEMYFEDSDKDSLVDILEKAIGTDPLKADTDGDELTDFYEVYLTSTDPLNTDTDGNKISDADEDNDIDGLTNIEEMNRGTNPVSDDSDSDGLKDGEEINEYHTDPLKFDTDGDKIGDGDEVKISLDPLNPYTHGILDSEYTIQQSISEDVLKTINDKNKYELSIDIKAAGFADNSISAAESGYAVSLSENDAILGKVINIDYDGLRVDNAVLKFTIPEANIEAPTGLYDDPGLEGIQRFQVFHYDEELNVLYPVQTEFDVSNDTISATSLELGVYCLVDMDKWMYGLGIAPEEETVPQMFSIKQNTPSFGNIEPGAVPVEDEKIIEPISLPANYDEIMQEQINNILGIDPNMPTPRSADESIYNRQIDLVFAIDTSGSMGGTLDACKENMSKIVNDLYDVGVTANVGIVTFGDYRQANVVQVLDGSIWAKTPQKASELISKVDLYAWGYENHLDAMETIMAMPFRKSAVKFAVLITDEPITLSDNNCYRINKTNTNDIANALRQNEIIASVVSAGYETFEPLYQETGGMATSVYGDFHRYLYDFICEKLKSMKGFNYIGANDLCSKMLADRLEKGGLTNSDFDGLTDSEEVNWDFITNVDTDGKILSLPTFYEYLENVRSNDVETYERMTEYERNAIMSINILPIISDPMNEDGDGDGLLDGEAKMNGNKKIGPEDPKPLKANGPIGVWQAQFEQEMNGNIPHEIGNVFDLAENDPSFFEGAGAFFLNFSYDENDTVLHSKILTWQWLGGYNNLYDMIFKKATNENMRNEKFYFYDSNGEENVLWIWRGDYLNLGSGAEAGIYTESSIPGHWDSVTFTLPMTLNLYNYYGEDNIDNVFCWAPNRKQWWITGFNPEFNNPKVEDMVSLGTIDFTGREDMFESMKNETAKKGDLGDYIIFDKDGHTVWLIWYDRGLVR